MRGICSISTCQFKDGSKLHEVFEGMEFNICWECGTKILQAVEFYDREFGGHIQWLN